MMAFGLQQLHLDGCKGKNDLAFCFCKYSESNIVFEVPNIHIESFPYEYLNWFHLSEASLLKKFSWRDN